MKPYGLPLVALLALLSWLGVPDPARADEGAAPGVVVRAGLVSARFTAAPLPVVRDAIQAATGIEIPIPPAAATRPVTLTIGPLPLEAFLRRLLAALDLGGFALVYEPGGAPDRAIVVAKGQGTPGPALGTRGPEPQRPPEPPGRRQVRVPFLIRTGEAKAMKLGAPGQVLVVQSPPVGRATTSECEGTTGEYPVQTVLVTTGTGAYVTSITVCRADALRLGETFGIESTDQATGLGSTSTFTATTQ